MRVCVCLHLYYMDMIPEIKSYLQNLKEYDMYITTPVDNQSKENEIRNQFDGAKIIYTENAGFDVYPFVCFLRQVNLDSYDVVYKLHTKKDIPIEYSLNGYDLSGGKWRYYLLNTILGSTDRVENILMDFEKNSNLGLIGAKELIVRDEAIDADIDMSEVCKTMEGMGLKIAKKEFVAGSMFVIRASLLRKMQERDYQESEFPPYLPRTWNELPYCLERCFGLIISAQNFKLKGMYADSTLADKKLLIKKKVQEKMPGLYGILQKMIKK